MELSNDTLFFYTNSGDSATLKWGMGLTLMDTFGNVIVHKPYLDSLGDNVVSTYPLSLVKLSNGTGYAAVGQYFQREGFLAKFDNLGNLVHFHEYSDSTSVHQKMRQIIEIEDGFLIGGSEDDGHLNVFILKVDFNGKMQWKKRYGRWDKANLFGNIFILNNNEYVIGGGTTISTSQTQFIKNTSRIYAIDSLGNLKWEWETPPSLEEGGVGNISLNDDGDWAYRSGRGWYNPSFNEIWRQPTFIIRDKDFNLIKRDTFGKADFFVNGFNNTLMLRDGGCLALGGQPVKYTTPPPLTPPGYNALAGWLLRLDKNNEEVWSRVDTAFWSTKSGSYNYYVDAVELPSGSIVACGISRTEEPNPKDWGWVIKVSKDGCIDTLFCHPVDAVSIENLNGKTRVYPNPTQSIINIENEKIDSWDRIEILNSIGQTVKLINKPDKSQIDLTGFEDGIYFLRLIKSGRSLTKKVIKNH